MGAIIGRHAQGKRKDSDRDRGGNRNASEIDQSDPYRNLVTEKAGKTKREGKVDDAIRVIAKSLDYACADRLHGTLGWMAKHLVAHQELVVSPETMNKLGKMSVSTLKRILKRVSHPLDKLAFHPPKRARTNTLRKLYPMGKIAWNEKEVGHLEVDLVHHGGSTAMGEYIHTLQMVDVATGWCEIVPIFGRSARVVNNGFQTLLKQIPFQIVEIHPDNGSEFFNQAIFALWQREYPTARISRSRPYDKNDNRFVEENNNSLIRAYLGNGRYDTMAHLAILKKVFPMLQRYHNLFLPARRLVEKQFTGPAVCKNGTTRARHHLIGSRNLVG